MVSCCELDQDRNSPFCFPLIQVNFIANISRFMKRKSFLKPVFHKSLELLTRYQVSLAPFCSLPVSQSLFALRKNTRKACGGSRAPKGRYTRGILQSSSVCTNDFMGIPHPREQNFHPAKCSTIFNRLNIWEQAPGANWANLKTLPRVYWHVQNDPGAMHSPGAKPLLCISLKPY